jgi:hypothetical protein
MTLLFVSTIGGLKQTRRLRVLLIIPVLALSLHVSRGLGFLFPWKRSGRMETGV